MLILAGVALSLTLGDSELFRRAENAANTWQMAEINEQSEMDEAADFIERYENKNKPLGSVTGEETTNSTVYDKYGNKVVVPAGFKIINPEDDVTKGIVIEDVNAGDEYTKESQFVWIPIGNVITDNNGTIVPLELGRYTFDDNEGEYHGKPTLVQSAQNWENMSDDIKIQGYFETYYKELSNSSYGNLPALDLEDFVRKVRENNGYYIGRYEAGDSTTTSNYPRNEESEDDNPVTCKSGVYPYNYISQPQASELCQNMYDNTNFQSDLSNSYAWDTAIVFIQTFGENNEYSLQSPIKATLAKCGETNDIQLNIYDMAGNVYEWSTETGLGDDPCTCRGGIYVDQSGYICGRGAASATGIFYNYAFRPIIYILN